MRGAGHEAALVFDRSECGRSCECGWLRISRLHHGWVGGAITVGRGRVHRRGVRRCEHAGRAVALRSARGVTVVVDLGTPADPLGLGPVQRSTLDRGGCTRALARPAGNAAVPAGRRPAGHPPGPLPALFGSRPLGVSERLGRGHGDGQRRPDVHQQIAHALHSGRAGAPVAFTYTDTHGVVHRVTPKANSPGFGMHLDAVANLQPGQSAMSNVWLSDSCPAFMNQKYVARFSIELPDTSSVSIIVPGSHDELAPGRLSVLGELVRHPARHGPAAGVPARPAEGDDAGARHSGDGTVVLVRRHVHEPDVEAHRPKPLPGVRRGLETDLLRCGPAPHLSPQLCRTSRYATRRDRRLRHALGGPRPTGPGPVVVDAAALE
jgi:hypothetical protein